MSNATRADTKGTSHVVSRAAASRAGHGKEPLVELSELSVDGLFGLYDYTIKFPHMAETATDPSLVILHGQNGLGKTTLLLMLDGMLEMDFDIFRVRPFKRAVLTLSSGQRLEVRHQERDGPLEIAFQEHHIRLDPKRKGVIDPRDSEAEEAFRTAFKLARRDITFQLITTARFPAKEYDRRYAEYWAIASRDTDDSPESRLAHKTDVLRRSSREPSLAGQVRQFILDAQVNYRQFFRFESDLFGRMMRITTEHSPPKYALDDLLKTISRIHTQDLRDARLGITPDQWDYDQLSALLNEPLNDIAVAVLGAYVEGLDSRARERAVLADRLVTFESVMTDFLTDKKVWVDGREGLRIEASNGGRLREDQLSSGEYHLLFLMVTALLARRRGSVIAIDEPEMSMHISWQQRLVRSLLRCASNARPQLILATHSPDIAAEYREFMTRLGPQ